jgi:hypothetical protein
MAVHNVSGVLGGMFKRGRRVKQLQIAEDLFMELVAMKHQKFIIAGLVKKL